MKTGEISMKVVGHELVTINVKIRKGTFEERQRLRVKFRGVDGDKRTAMVLMTEPDAVDEFPLGEIATLSLEVKQGRLELANAH